MGTLSLGPCRHTLLLHEPLFACLSCILTGWLCESDEVEWRKCNEKYAGECAAQRTVGVRKSLT